ncbi:MAG: NFACT family protein [Methanomassiliicoccales archaeon]|nr:MAG: NFACT family protein [Methanomassiliicoccales archaeon]
MKEGMSSFDIAAMVKELQCLLGGRIDKAYQPDRDKLLLRIRVPEEGRKDLVIVVGKWLYLASQPQETPKTPSSFAMLLRKHLSNGKITKIEQHEFDRIVVFHIEKKESYQLICEIFGEGNVVLVQEGKIIQPLIPISWCDWEVRAKREYVFPPSRQDVRKFDLEDFWKILSASKKDIVRTLAMDVNLGGIYAEEVCLLSGIEKDKKAADLGSKEVGKTFEITKKLVESLDTSKGGHMIFKGDASKDIIPFELEGYKDKKSVTFDNLSMAIEKYLTIKKEEEPEDVEYEDIRGKYERQLAQQKKAVINQMKKAEKLKNTAELIYNNYANCEKVMEVLREGIKNKNMEELTSQLKETTSFKALDAEKNEVTMGLFDEEGNEIDLIINYKKSLEENAGIYYDKAKKAKEKLEGAKKSLKQTKNKLAGIETEKKMKIKSAKRQVKMFWFEKYRWFISSDGNIVIAGRDAKTNDKVVKKYLTDKDRYAHAEIHGAPSVVVKNRDGEISEQTLKEACEFAFCHSKAWNANIGSGTAYWVLPDQVSKTPPSGEFLPRGSFMVRGRKNSITYIELRLGIGVIEYEGAQKVMCAPISAMESQSKGYVIFEPGDMKKSTFIRKICEILDVEHEEVQRILPPGDVKVVGSVGIPENKI